MKITREDLKSSLMKSYGVWHDMTVDCQEASVPLTAKAEFCSRNEKYVLVKQAKLWAAENYEYTYFFDTEHLTLETAKSCVEYTLKQGMDKVRPHSEHMYSYITAFFLADTVDIPAADYLRKAKFYKSFRFSFHGWAALRTVAVDVQKEMVWTNHYGKELRKLYQTVRRTCEKNALGPANKIVTRSESS